MKRILLPLLLSLFPLAAWANRQIDHFTLGIRVPHTAKHFLIYGDLFQSTPFRITEGVGKVRRNRTHCGKQSVLEVSLRDGTLEWQDPNFAAKDELLITSADRLFGNPQPIGSFYEPQPFLPHVQEGVWQGFHVPSQPALRPPGVRSSATRGLKGFFEIQWWYMPDSSWKPSTADFTREEQELHPRQNELHAEFED